MLLQSKMVNAADFPTLQMAVDALEEFGTLYVPAGEWACSGIKLKSNMTLHLALGAKLVAPARIEEYVPCPDWHRGSSLTCAFLALYEVENVVIEGEGMLELGGERFWIDFDNDPALRLSGVWNKISDMGLESCKSKIHIIGVTSQSEDIDRRGSSFREFGCRIAMVCLGRCQDEIWSQPAFKDNELELCRLRESVCCNVSPYSQGLAAEQRRAGLSSRFRTVESLIGVVGFNGIEVNGS